MGSQTARDIIEEEAVNQVEKAAKVIEDVKKETADFWKEKLGL